MADKPLRIRLIVAAILVPLVVIFTFIGGWPFSVFVGLALALAAWEFWRMFRMGDFSPSLAVMLVFTIAAIWLRSKVQFRYMDLWLAALILVSLSVAVVQQMRAVPNSAFNFAITISGALYTGWLGGYMISLRNLPDGLIWTLIVLFAASAGDAGGYLFGSLWGRHKIAPALSPQKSWEGYFGGVFVSSVSTWLITLAIHSYVPQILPMHGLILGCILAVLTPFGDFAESMLKRQFNLKDTSRLLPGHGGIMDRIDSSLWAITIGFYIIQLFF